DGRPTGGAADETVDAAGGWHDAGDTLKFVETTSYAALLLLYAADRYPGAFEAGGSRLLPPVGEAGVGLGLLLKMFARSPVCFQVGSEQEHDFWCMPEQEGPRLPAFLRPRLVCAGVGANLAGRTAGALALASRLYRAPDPPFAARCEREARRIY